LKKVIENCPKRLEEKQRKKELIFRNNPLDIRLKTHKLSGIYKNCWAFWIDDCYCIKFVFLSRREVLFLDIGTHDIYKK